MSERALVLGGGGSAGNAWEIGVIAGLLDGGLDVDECARKVADRSGFLQNISAGQRDG